MYCNSHNFISKISANQLHLLIVYRKSMEFQVLEEKINIIEMKESMEYNEVKSRIHNTKGV